MEMQNDTLYAAQASPLPSNESWMSFYIVLLILYPLVCALFRNDRLRTTYVFPGHSLRFLEPW